jgi:CubicO group peptidase (beta-lactamase class C family)
LGSVLRPSVDKFVELSLAADPGKNFIYSDAGAELVAAVLTEAVDRPVLAYGREKLFDRLGIQTRPTRPKPPPAYVVQCKYYTSAERPMVGTSRACRQIEHRRYGLRDAMRQSRRAAPRVQRRLPKRAAANASSRRDQLGTTLTFRFRITTSVLVGHGNAVFGGCARIVMTADKSSLC